MKPLAFCALVAALALAPTARGAGDESGLGSKDPGLLNLRGTIYFLTAQTRRMPADLAALVPEGVIYTDKLDVPVRSFKAGFPGVTDRFEWFAVVYEGTFEIAKAGEYRWRLVSDDGARLWLDGEEIIDNDGVHGPRVAKGASDLVKGRHTMKVWYFQGPAHQIALQLFVEPPEARETIFALSDYSGALRKALGEIKAEPTAKGIKISLDAALLFDTARADIKPAARRKIGAVAKVLEAYPTARVRIEGHTDDAGDEESNQTLSEERARAVVQSLEKAGVPDVASLEAKGFGESEPVASNKTTRGRARNRRVEIYVVP
ncbi:MAG: OmpA family protein [Pseudomonadota bacterium]